MGHCIFQHEIVVTMFDGLGNFIPVVIRHRAETFFSG
jgi:hypothetical protein